MGIACRLYVVLLTAVKRGGERDCSVLLGKTGELLVVMATLHIFQQ